MRNRNDSNDNENYNNHLPEKEENQIAKVSQLNFPLQHSDSASTYLLGTAKRSSTSVYSMGERYMSIESGTIGTSGIIATLCTVIVNGTSFDITYLLR